MSARAALVLFSGGQDSATCLAWALERYERVETLGFDYGQRHAVELRCRGTVLARMRQQFPRWTARLAEDHTLALPVLGEISDSALVQEQEIVLRANGLPSTFVPGRNLAFLVLAAALAYRRGITDLVGGMCETDFSGYPDCRDATLQALAHAISLGMDRGFSVHTPLMHLDKADTWRLARSLGGEALVGLIVRETHTCYLGQRGTLHDWGHGCGTCPACVLRARGWERFREGGEGA